MVQQIDVVITGVGVVSPIGVGKQSFWSALREARSGVRTLEELRDSPFPVKFGAPVTDFDARQYIKPRKAIKVMSREIQTGYAAASMAMEDASLDVSRLDAERFGVVFASDMLYCDPTELMEPFAQCVHEHEFDFRHWGPRAIQQLFPLWMLKYLPNMTACHVGIASDARGPNNTICQGEASSLLAIIEAAEVIRRGHADIMITGGSSSRLSLTPLMYRGAANRSRRNEQPEAASRPFDAHRDGMVDGEGAAALVLESRAHAESRGAAVLAVLRGYGRTFDPRCQGRQIDQDPLACSFQHALRTADLRPDQIGHVNANGLSTREDDQREAQAIRAVLGDIPVTAPKSLFGNLGAAGGSLETVACILALAAGEIPPTRNYEQPDPDCPIQVVAGGVQAVRQPTALVTSQSTTGQVASMILSRS